LTGSAGFRNQSLIAFFQSVDALIHYTTTSPIASETFPDPPEPSKAVSNSSAKSLVSTLIATKVEAKETLPFVNTETEHQSLISKYQISSGTFSKMDCSASFSTANIYQSIIKAK
jgi:hypothetical protein